MKKRFNNDFLVREVLSQKSREPWTVNKNADFEVGEIWCDRLNWMF